MRALNNFFFLRNQTIASRSWTWKRLFNCSLARKSGERRKHLPMMKQVKQFYFPFDVLHKTLQLIVIAREQQSKLSRLEMLWKFIASVILTFNFSSVIRTRIGPQLVDSRKKTKLQSKQEDDEGVIVDPVITVSDIQVYEVTTTSTTASVEENSVELSSSTSSESTSTETEAAIANEDDANPINRYCKCSSYECDCCREFSLPLVPIRGPGCANIRYLEGDRMSVGIKFGNRVLANRVISGKNSRLIEFLNVYRCLKIRSQGHARLLAAAWRLHQLLRSHLRNFQEERRIQGLFGAGASSWRGSWSGAESFLLFIRTSRAEGDGSWAHPSGTGEGGRRW